MRTSFFKFFDEITELTLKESWSWSDFVVAQRLRCDIKNVYNTNLNSTEPSPISYGEYSLLNHMVSFLMGKMRAFLTGGEFK